jgi:parallel beta-helix repeat protein
MLLLTDNLTITKDSTLERGIYHLPNGIHIEGSSITLDGNGAVLVGDNFSGNGISSSGGEDITIKNITIEGYAHGITIKKSKGLRITGCKISGTQEVPANSIFLDIWISTRDTYGSGIFLEQVEQGLIEANDISHQMNGLLSYQCQGLQVRDNLANYCSGWGFHLNEASHCLFENNYADFCCRYEPRGERIGHMGADSTGFLIVNRSCDNIFRQNRARLGGDGFFLSGMTPGNETVGCDNNLFEDNDASYSPNNAFEATFSRGNIFRGNYANFSNYGFWLGFSRDGTIENNQIIGNRQAGIAAENGVNFNVNRNIISNNRHGILLWSKHLPQFDQGMPENTTSMSWTIERNTFSGNHKAIRIAADQDHGIEPLPASGELGYPAPKPANHVIRNNLFEKNVHVLEQIDTLDTRIDSNEMRNNYHE